MAKIEQEYEGSADNVTVKSNKKRKNISMSLPRISNVNIEIERNKKYRLFVELEKSHKKAESNKTSEKEEG